MDNFWAWAVGAFIALVFSSVLFTVARYRRCPSDKVLVIFGRVGTEQSSRCMHGGGTLVWPLIQDYAYLSLTPMTISIPLQNALSQQNIRINVPSTFTVGISTDPGTMHNAAERLLGLQPKAIEDMAKEIIFGQLRLTVASLTIEEINQDRERFLDSIRKNVEPELNKIGLNLINVNITDITDESDYIESIGKKASSEAINRARVDVAEEEKRGAIGEAHANREKTISVAENLAEADKGQKKADAERRIYVHSQEAEAVRGENEANATIALSNAELAIRNAEAEAEADKGQKKADAERRIYVHGREAAAVQGENEANAQIADSNAALAVKRAEAERLAGVAKRHAEAEIQKAQYLAEQERLNAEEVVKHEVEKRKIEILAEAAAERKRREAKGEADAIRLRYEAEANGIRQVLESKAIGYDMLVRSCQNDAKAAATLLMVEKIEEIVKSQVDAIKGLKIDKITVWDSGGNEGKGSSTAGFISSLIKSVPPLHDVAAMAGIELPEYLGQAVPGDELPASPSRPDDEESDAEPASA